MRRLGIAVVVVLVLLVVVEWVVPRLARGPVARLLERQANGALHGYALRIGAAELRPLRLGVRMRDVVVQDSDRSEPPIARAPIVDAGLGLSGFRLRTWTTMRRPRIEVDEARLREIRRTRLGDQLTASGRRAVERLERFGVALGAVDIEDGRVAWRAPEGDVALTHVGLRLANDSGRLAGGADDRFALDLRARVGGTGRLRVDGRTAPFVRGTPPMALRLAVDELPLAAAAPLAARARLEVRTGTLSAAARVRVARPVLDVRVREAAVRGADVDFAHRAPSWAAERATLAQAAARGREAARGWRPVLAARRVLVTGSTVGVRDATRTPPYRLFLTVDRVEVEHAGTAPGAAPARVAVRARPMGTGALDLDATLRAHRRHADVRCRLDLRDVDLTTLNDALRAYGGTPLARGTFALALEAAVHDGRIAGYAKPLFTDVELRQNPEAGIARRMAEAAIGGVTSLLEDARGVVATRTTLSGTLEDPEAGAWEALVGVLSNAYVESIQPGFDRAIRGG